MLSTHKLQNLSRFQAFLGHILLSGLILLTLLAFMLYAWFPGKSFLYDGGLQGLKILLPVDLVLGPVLTLIIFNPKKSLSAISTDLTVIFSIQLLALGWGLFQVHKARTTHIVHYNDGFYWVKQDQLNDNHFNVEDLTKEDTPPPTVAWYQPPRLVALKPAENEDENIRRNISAQVGQFMGGGPMYEYHLFIPISESNVAAGDYKAHFRYASSQTHYDATQHQLTHIEIVKDKTLWQLVTAK